MTTCLKFESLSETSRKVGELRYGAIFNEVPGHSRSVYIKLNKKKTGDGTGIRYPSNHCVLCNLKTGTIRAISGDTVVQVLDMTAVFDKTQDIGESLKHGGVGYDDCD